MPIARMPRTNLDPLRAIPTQGLKPDLGIYSVDLISFSGTRRPLG